MRLLWAFVLGITLSIGTLCSQQTSLSGPMEGYVFDLPTQSFLPVIGLPGSATFGSALISGFDSGWVAPHKNYGIAFQQGNCFLVTGLDSNPVSTGVAGVSGPPDAVVWSGDGSVAILYSRGGAWLQTVTGLPGAPQANALVDLSSLGGSLTAVAADRTGQNTAVAMQGANGGVFLSSDGQNFVSALSMANPAGLTFSSDGASLYILDGGAITLTSFALSDSSSQTFALNGLPNPSAIATGRDAQGRPIVLVADSTDQIFQAYDPATQQMVANIPLYFQPTGIATLGQNSFVIYSRSQSGSPLWLFASVPQPAVYFVPAAQPNAGGSN